jgi:hypothetical protein
MALPEWVAGWKVGGFRGDSTPGSADYPGHVVADFDKDGLFGDERWAGPNPASAVLS